jgi:concentrative nucleoside transporter, CNT family
MERLNALLGILVIIGVAVLLSENRRKIQKRVAVVRLSLAILLAVAIFKLPGISDFFDLLARATDFLSHCSLAGLRFIVGDTLADGAFYKPGPVSTEFIFALRVGLPIIFFCGLFFIGEHLGLWRRIIKVLGLLMEKTLKLTGAESLSLIAAPLIGQVECQALIRHHISKLTRSQLFTTICGGMATISGSALLGYVAIEMPAKPLIAASIMSVVTAILLSKIFIPETEATNAGETVEIESLDKAPSWTIALGNGLDFGWEIARRVVLVVFFAVAAIWGINQGVLAVSGYFGHAMEISDILAIPMWPIAKLISVPFSECFHVARMMANELVFNEFVSYGELAQVIQGKGSYELMLRTQTIASVALCGFAHLGSVGINILGLSVMAPKRSAEISKLVWKALLVANMATWLSAAICGLII